MESITSQTASEGQRAGNAISRDFVPPRTTLPFSRPAEGRFPQRKPTPSPLQASEVASSTADLRTQNNPQSPISPPAPRTASGSQHSNSPQSPRFQLAGELSSPPKSPRDRLDELLASEAFTTNDLANTRKDTRPLRPTSPISPKTQSYSQLRNVSSPIPQTQALSNSPPPSPRSSNPSNFTSTTMRPDARSFPRTSSIDSAISSISTATSHSYKSSQESLRSNTPDISHLINTAGSAEAVIQHLLKEKHHAAAQNAQLWKLVDKQRALVLGLNQDLERAVKDKERYRKKVKEHLAQVPPLPGKHSQSTSPRASMRPPSRSDVNEELSSRGENTHAQNGAIRPVGDDVAHAGEEARNTVKGSNPRSAVAAKSGVQEPLACKESTTFNSGKMMPLLQTSGLDEPKDGRSPDTPKQNINKAASPGSFTAKRSNPLQKAPQFPTMALTETTPVTALDQSTLPFRKLPPAPLDLKKPKSGAPNPSDFGPEDHSGSDYDDIIDEDELPVFERGRKKTREEDDEEREVMAIKAQLERSGSKKGKRSKTPSESAPAKVGGLQTSNKNQQASMPAGIKSLSPPLASGGDSSLLSAPNSLASVLSPTTRQHRSSSEGKVLLVAPLSPGLPLSPRPSDRPMNSPAPRMPRDSKSTSLLSPPLSARSGLPLSPRAPRHPIPLPPQTPSSIVSPMSQADMRPEPLVAVRRPDTPPAAYPVEGKQNNKHTKTDSQSKPEPQTKSTTKELPEEWQPESVFKGFISDTYPGVLIPPNALPSIVVKVISSRLKPSRLSYMAPRGNDDEPVFTLGVSARSDMQELWQVEKSVLSLPPLDNELKTSSTFNVKLPDRSLFTGHAPTKIDARRTALESYFESVLDTPMDDNGALVICRYLSTNVIGSRDDGAGNSLPPEAGTPVTLGPDGRLMKEGYLTKRGKNFGGWKARFFVLNEPTLRYYESPGGSLLGTIRLHNAQIGKQSPQQAHSPSRSNDESDNQYRHAFLILEPKRNNPNSHVRHVLCAESDTERDIWVEALLHYVDGPGGDAKAKAGAPSSALPSSKLVKKQVPKKEEIMANSPESATFEDLKGVNYESTVPAQAPVVRVMPEQRPSDSPSPTAASTQSTARTQGYATKPISAPVNGAKIEDAGAWGASKVISGPSNGVKIENAGAWGNKTQTAPPPPPSAKEHRKRSNFWGLRDRNPSDLSTAHSNESSISLTQQQQQNAERAANVRPSFGVPLAEAVEFSPPRGMPGVCLPAVVYRCLEYLEAHDAASEEGIFRLSGSSVVIKALRDRFNTEGDFDFLADEQYYDVHAVASLLKLYLRELPSTVLTRELHLKFLAVLGKAPPSIYPIAISRTFD
ncbi:MAG: hypothetical protein Q9195_007111 [Heterodermia aff. obscurata]